MKQQKTKNTLLFINKVTPENQIVGENFFRILKDTLYTEKNTGVYLKKTVVELTKIFIKTQPTTLVVELMNEIRKSHFVINLTNLFVNITK